ncbi:MAG: M14 family zinc carboxypeptidase, partial [Thermomicrobiales bacterium]
MDAASNNTSPRRDGGGISAPHVALGTRPGTDGFLPRWSALLTYFAGVAERSDRVQITEIGRGWGGEPLVLLTISSPANLANQNELRRIQRRLADQRPALSMRERADLLARGRTICCVTCSIHPTEVGGTLMTPDLVHHLATDDSAQTLEILDRVVLLLIPSLNPDGWERVVDWHAESVGTEREGTIPPGLYHPVAGHDNNRDWFMRNLPETRAVIDHVHRRWYPHVVHDLHQMSSFGPRYVVPPFIDPYDPFVHPLLQAQATELGTMIAAELTGRGLVGIATSTVFDAFSASRAYQHYHGGVRILSEAASARLASPMSIAPDQLVPLHGFDPHRAAVRHPRPWPGGEWGIGDIVRHNRIAVDTTLRHAASSRDRWVRNFAIVQADALRSRDVAAFILPPLADQPDPAVARDLIGLLLAGGVEVAETIGPSGPVAPGSFTVPTAQPFGAFARTLLTDQSYPWGDKASTPYDTTTHALPLMMGVTSVGVNEPPMVESRPLAALPPSPGGIR